MAEHLLDAAQVRIAVEQVGCKRVAHVMRAQGIIETRRANRALEHRAYRIGAHRVSAGRDKHAVARLVSEQHGPRFAEVRLQRFDADVVQGDDALLASLAKHLHELRFEIDVG